MCEKIDSTPRYPHRSFAVFFGPNPVGPMRPESTGRAPCGAPAELLSGRSVLVTGGTGFIGKALIAKLIRDVPSIGQIYVLVRGRQSDAGKSAGGRLASEILESEPLASLAAELGDRARIRAVEGDLTRPGLGLSPQVKRELCRRLSVIFNCAGVVQFDGDLREATLVNAIAPLRLLELAQACRNRCALIHLSTAYVNGLRRGLAKEEPLLPDHSIASELHGAAAPFFSLDAELRRGLDEERDASGKELKESAARRASIVRARRHGWTDTYTFTKALGEQLLTRNRGRTAISIIRPSVVSGSIADPYPGWIDGMKVMDPLIVAYAKGHLSWFVGDADRCLDVVPVDYVVNTTLAAITPALAHGGLEVFQVASGMTNPLRLAEIANAAIAHFERLPLAGKRASGSIRFMSHRRVRARIRRDRALCHTIAGASRLLPGAGAWGLRMLQNLRALDRIEQYTYLYLPYVTYECQFDSSRTEMLLDSLPESARGRFGFDVRNIDWPHYFDRVHIPGLRRFVLGEAPVVSDLETA